MDLKRISGKNNWERFKSIIGLSLVNIPWPVELGHSYMTSTSILTLAPTIHSVFGKLVIPTTIQFGYY